MQANKHIEIQKLQTNYFKLLFNKENYLKSILVFIALISTRIYGAIYYQNFFGDAFAYYFKIKFIKAEIINGRFTIGDLFDIWVPFYQFVCALFILPVSSGSPLILLIPKLVTALFGIILVYLLIELTYLISKNINTALVTGIFAILNPTLFVNSVTTMTDVPYFAVLLFSFLLLLKRKYNLSMIVFSIACLTRSDGWFMAPLYLLILFYDTKSISTTLKALGFIIAAFAFWALVSYDSFGVWFKSFEIRSEYVKGRAKFVPELYALNWFNINYNFTNLFSSSFYFIVFSLFFVIVSTFKKKLIRLKSLFDYFSTNNKAYTYSIVFFLYLLLFYTSAFFAKQQSEFYSRYGLSLLCFSLPLAISILFILIKNNKYYSLLYLLFIGLTANNYYTQAELYKGYYYPVEYHETIKDYIRLWHKNNPNKKVYIDSKIYNVLSNLDDSVFISSNYFLRNYNVQVSNFDSLINLNKVGLVIADIGEFRYPIKFMPKLTHNKKLGIYNPVLLFADSTVNRHINTYIYEVKN